MKRRFGKLVSVLVVAGIAVGVWIWWRGAARAEPLPEVSAGAREAAAAGNGFAFDLYGKLRGRSGNMLFSPYSIHAGLAMAHEGAGHRTAEELSKVLHLSEGARAGQRDLHGRLEAAGYHGFDLAVANRLWADRRVSILPAFNTRLADLFGAEIEGLDFADAAGTAGKINAWGAARTHGRIAEMVTATDLAPPTVLVLANAIYFKGNWNVPFKRSATREGDFFVEAGKKVPAMMMSQQEKHDFADVEAAGDVPAFRAVSLKYTAGDLEMVMLLPELAELGKLEAALSEKLLDSVVKEMHETWLPVTFPRFTMRDSFSLAGTLKEMGVMDAFNEGTADFSKLSAGTPLFIAEVLHKTFIDVNEEGTEAAAETVVRTKTSAAPKGRPREFKADHPFIFVIRDRESGAVLFIGRVANPVGVVESSSR